MVAGNTVLTIREKKRKKVLVILIPTTDNRNLYEPIKLAINFAHFLTYRVTIDTHMFDLCEQQQFMGASTQPHPHLESDLLALGQICSIGRKEILQS